MKAATSVLEGKVGRKCYDGKNIQVETAEGDGIRVDLRHYYSEITPTITIAANNPGWCCGSFHK